MIDTRIKQIGDHRSTLVNKNIKKWLAAAGLPYHSPRKFRHGHAQYRQALAKSIADYKAISLNLLHSSMDITDQFYSNINEGEVRNRISSLGKDNLSTDDNQEAIKLFKEFLAWKRNRH